MSSFSPAQSRDIKHQMHPYTNDVAHKTIGPRIIERGEGIYVYDDQGNKFLEAMAGLWSVAVGFGEPRLVEAATRQLQKLPNPRTSPTSGWPASSRKAACMMAPVVAAFSTSLRSWMMFRFSIATAVATGWPLAV